MTTIIMTVYIYIYILVVDQIYIYTCCRLDGYGCIVLVVCHDSVLSEFLVDLVSGTWCPNTSIQLLRMHFKFMYVD